MNNTFEINEQIKDNIVVLNVSGELDALVAPQLKEIFSKFMDKDKVNFVVNFENLVHINSLAMGILRGKLQILKEVNGDIKIACLNEHIKTIFETIGLDEIFEIYDTEEEAIKQFSR